MKLVDKRKEDSHGQEKNHSSVIREGVQRTMETRRKKIRYYGRDI